MTHILVVDETSANCSIAKLALEADGAYQVTTASTAFDAVEAIELRHPQGAIIEAAMPQVSGLAIARHALSAGIPVLMMSGDTETQRALKAAGVPCLAKPLQVRDIVIQTMLLLQEARERHAQLTMQIARLAKTLVDLGEIIEHSRTLLQESEELRRRRTRS